MPELKGRDTSRFQSHPIDLESIPYKDKGREKQALALRKKKGRLTFHARKFSNWMHNNAACVIVELCKPTVAVWNSIILIFNFIEFHFSLEAAWIAKIDTRKKKLKTKSREERRIARKSTRQKKVLAPLRSRRMQDWIFLNCSTHSLPLNWMNWCKKLVFSNATKLGRYETSFFGLRLLYCRYQRKR